MQRDRIHAGYVGERRLQPGHQFERALREMSGCQRMDAGEAAERRHFVVHHRVILHRARPQRVELQRLREVELRQAQKMADHLRLAELGKSRQVRAAQLRAKNFRARSPSRRARCDIGSVPAFGRQIENERNLNRLSWLIEIRLWFHCYDWFDPARRRHHRASANTSASKPNSALRFISVTEIKTLSLNSG